MRVHTTFDEVFIRRTRTYTDPSTGKRRQQSRKFWQTVNPFNCNADGSIKSREDILRELRQDANRWEAGLPDSPPEVP